MASVMRGEDRRSDWLYAGNHYFPSNLPLTRQFSVDRNSGTDKTGPTRSTRHQRIPSASFLMEEQLSWLDDLLDDEEIKSGSHRRSASDSFAFYDASESLYGISNIAEEDEVKCLNLKKTRGCSTLSQERCQQNLFPESNQSNHSISLNASKESLSSESSKTQRRGNYPSMPEHASTSHGAILPETVEGGAPEHLACEQNELSWLDDLLDNSENLSRKVGHRRSASDSFTFLKAPGYLHKITGIAEDEEFDCNTTDQQFRFYNDKHSLRRSQHVSAYNLQKQHSLPVIMSDSLFNSDNRLELVRPPFVHEKSISDVSRIHRTIGGTSDVRLLQTTSKEVQNFGDAIPSNRQGELKPTGETADPNIDPKRAKRTLANRQSAQRSRVRKLLYIAELETNVDALQTEVSALSLQVAYLEHQRVLLNVDNNTTKQCIARLAKDKKLKDAQNEALKIELQKLRKFYQFQFQQHEHDSERTLKKSNACHNNQQRFCPPAFDIIPEEFSKLHLGSQKKSELKSPV